MNHSNIGHSDEVTLAVRMPGILLYLTTNRMLLGNGVNKSLDYFFFHFSCRNIQIGVFCEEIFESWCFMQKYWSLNENTT